MTGRCLLLGMLALLLGACTMFIPEQRPVSAGHLSPEAPAPTGEIPSVVTQAPVLPPPTPERPSEKYTVVVNDVPVRELLFALARDAKVNVDIHPAITGIVTINAVDQTLPQILDRLARQVDIRYEIKDRTLVIAPDTPYLRTYAIDYVNMSRDVTKTVSVATQIDTTGGGDTMGQGEGGGAGGAGDNNSTTHVTSVSNQRFWQTLVANVANIVGDQMGPEAGTGSGVLGTASVIANPETGLLTVRATQRRHAEVQAFVDEVLTNAQREVLVEATIVEVDLSDRYQAGIDWEKLARDAGFSFQQALLGADLATAPFFLLNYADTQTDEGSVDVTVRMLRNFGDVQVLSSPKVMVLNNQTALLRVVDNEVFFTIDVDSTTTQGVVDRTFETTIHTVPVGFIMSVTPGIHENGNVILNVRPTISRIARFVADPNPALALNDVQNLIPVIQTREMESMLKVHSGQIAVLGGLMTDVANVTTDGVPFLSQIPQIGELFKNRDNQYIKSELVIFLRPIIVANPSLQGDLANYKRYLSPELDMDIARNPPLPIPVVP